MSNLPCDLLLTAPWLLPEGGAQAIADGAIAITDGRIQAVGQRANLAAEYQPTVHTDLPHHLLTAGFVNAHCHGAMTLLKGLGEGLSLMPWLETAVWPAEQQLVSSEFVSLGVDLALLEMIENGVTCFSDMYFFPAVTAARASAAGVRCQIAGPIIDGVNAWSKSGDDSLGQVLALFDEWRHHPLVSIALGPHSAYALSWPMLEKVQMYADELDAGVHIHLHENAEEVAGAQRLRGSSWIAALEELGMLNPRLQAVHLTTVTEAEIELLGERRVNAVHCPHSNLKLASGISPIGRLAAAGVNVALGTDGALSNNTLDVLSEARLATLLGRHLSDDATSPSAAQALAMASHQGAEALGLADLGKLAVDQHADIAAFDLHNPALMPLRDPVNQLLHAGGNLRASDVWVAGQALLVSGVHQTLDREGILTRVQRWHGTMST